MGFKGNKYKLKSYQERACSFTKKYKKVLLALPTGSGKTLSSTFSINDTLGSGFRVLFFTETVAIDDIIESMETFFTKGTFKPVSTIGCNFAIRENLYSDFVSGEDINSIISTYAIMRNDQAYLSTLIKYFKSQGIKVALVIDEATQVKNEESLNHKVAKSLGAYCDLVIALTATPISSKLNDIDNIIRCLNTKNYISKEQFRNRFEINTFDMEGFLFKVTGADVYINSDDSPVPDKVVKKGRAYFKIPWKVSKILEPKKIIIHTKKPQSHLLNSVEVFLPSLTNRDRDFTGDITPTIKYDKVTNKLILYTPIVKCVNDSSVRYRTVGFSIIYYNHKSKKEQEINYVYSFSYDIGGNLIGYKNLNEYKEITKEVLFTLGKDEVGEIPPYVLMRRHFHNDSYTKKAVCNVYENSKGGTTSVARIMIATSAPSYILEDKLTINNKAKTLIEDLKSELSNEPIIIYSSLVSVLKYLSEVLESKNIEHCIYHGQLSNEEKTRNKNLFKSGKSKIILASSAAAKGVNLQIAKTVIFYDGGTYTAEFFQQVAGRVGRLGSLHKSLNIIAYQAESEEAIENCLYRNVMGQMNFILKVDSNLVDVNLIDKSITDLIDPEDSDKYILNRLGHSKRYYYGNK